MKRKNKRITFFISIVISLITFVTVIVSSVGAAYLKRSEYVVNTFKPASSINPGIEEEFDKTVKKNVYFKVGNTDYPVYVRVKIVVTWQKDGIVYYDPPVATGENPDYYIDLNTNDWTLEDDGFYYFDKVVQSGGETSLLIKECYQLPDAKAPEGYTLSVELIVQTVQAVGYTDGKDNTNENDPDKIDAWKDAWGIS